MNYKGDLLATASQKGTLIRIFKVENGQLIKELRRGIESTIIYSIDFDYFDAWIACVSKSLSTHVWELDKNDNTKNTGILSFLTSGT